MQTIYIGECVSYAGKRYRVQIDNVRSSAPSAPVELVLGDEGVEITRNEIDVFDPVFSMGCKVSVWSDTNYRFASLMTAPDRTYRMTVSEVPGDVIFTGWITSELYEEEYDRPPYLVSITASDGLAGLADYKVDVNALPAPVAGRKLLASVADIIEAAVRRTGLDLPIVWHSDITTQSTSVMDVNNPMTYVDRAALGNIYVDRAALFEDKGAEKASDTLESFLVAFSLRVYQHAGQWHIDRIPARIAKPASVVVLDTPALPFINGSTLSINAAFGSQTIKLNADRFESLTHIPYLPEGATMPVYSGSARPPADAVWRLKNPRVNLEKASGKYAIKATLYKGGAYPGDPMMVVAIPFSNYQVGGTITFRYSIRINGASECKNKLIFINRFHFYSGDRRVAIKAYYSFLYNNLRKEANAPQILTSYEGYDFVGYQYRTEAEIQEYNDKKDEYEISYTMDITESFVTKDPNLIYIEIPFLIYTTAKNRDDVRNNVAPIVYKSLEMSDVTIQVSPPKAEDDIPDALTATLATGYVREAPEVSLRLRSDSSHIKLDEGYKGVIYDNTGMILSGVYAGGVQKSIEQLLAETIFGQYAHARDVLSGTLAASSMLPPNAIYTNQYRDNRRYILSSLIFRLMDDEQEATFTEVKTDNKINATWQQK